MARKVSGLRFQSPSGSPARTVPTGKRQRLSIERLAHDGRGIAFLEGRTWFVLNALPGEEVEARVLSARNKLVDARAERWFQTSPTRIQPVCAYAGQCGGCSLQHLSAAHQQELKQQALADQLSRAGVTPEQWAEPLLGADWAYRRRARLAAHWNPEHKKLNLGFRAAASQDIVSIEHCPVLVPELQALLAPLQAFIPSLTHPRSVGHLELFSGSAVALLLRLTSKLPEAELQRWQDFCAAQGIQFWLQLDADPQATQASVLDYALEDRQLRLGYRPGDFVQVNAVINQAMVAQALDWLAVQPHEAVLDLFCGLGNFSLPLALQAASVLGVEGVDTMVVQAVANAQLNALSDKARFVRANLDNPEFWAEDAVNTVSAILLDPPREGALTAVSHMGKTAAQRVLYVSCNPATLARDAAVLQQQGFQLRQVGMLDMFPQTAHVEAMALFVRH